MKKINIEKKEEADINAWASSAQRNEHNNFLEHKIQKMVAADTFLNKIKKYETIFQSSHSILELGGGSCWASHIVKKKYPNAFVVGTDIAHAAIKSSHIWESVFNVQIDEVQSCTSYKTPFSDQSFDLIFCFESAHHFGRHYQTLIEIKRLLKPNGICLYLHEPACQPYIYPLAYKRVNSLREEVKEDILVYRKIIKLCESVGLHGKVDFDPILGNRKPKQTIYYYTLSIFPFLQHVLPCCIDIKIKK